jgi:hypothetical protein
MATTPPTDEPICETTAEIVARFPHLPARFTLHPLSLKRIHDLILAKHGQDRVKHAEAEAILFQLDVLDRALGKVLNEEGLLFGGSSVTGSNILEELTKD